MQRIKSGERTAIMLESPDDARLCHHKGKLHSKVELPPEVEEIMQKRGTKFDKNSPNIMAVHCEREILNFLKEEHPELEDDIIILSTMDGKEGIELWREDNMLALHDFVHAYVVLSQQERMVREDWKACRLITERFTKALNGDKYSKYSLIALFHNRFHGRPLTIEELQKMKEQRAAHEARLNPRSGFSFKIPTQMPQYMKRNGAL